MLKPLPQETFQEGDMVWSMVPVSFRGHMSAKIEVIQRPRHFFTALMNKIGLLKPGKVSIKFTYKDIEAKSLIPVLATKGGAYFSRVFTDRVGKKISIKDPDEEQDDIMLIEVGVDTKTADKFQLNLLMTQVYN